MMKTILVVDDEFGIAEVLESILIDEGYRVHSAVNGQQALARLSEVEPDLILLDFMMPVLDGPGLIRQLNQNPAWRPIPIILMSSLPEATMPDDIRDHAVFLRKPFRIDHVTALIKSLLEGSTAS